MGSQKIRKPCIHTDSILHEFLPPISQQNRFTLVIRSVLKPEDIDRIIEMAWEDRTPFDAIFAQFGLREDDVKALMKRELHPNNWRKWRARVHGRANLITTVAMFREPLTIYDLVCRFAASEINSRI